MPAEQIRDYSKLSDRDLLILVNRDTDEMRPSVAKIPALEHTVRNIDMFVFNHENPSHGLAHRFMKVEQKQANCLNGLVAAKTSHGQDVSRVLTVVGLLLTLGLLLVAAYAVHQQMALRQNPAPAIASD